MKNIFVFLLMLTFVGCSYSTPKTIYVNSKKIVVENWDDIPDDIKEKLIKIDEKAKKIDDIKNNIDKIKEDVNDIKKKDVV